MLTDRPCRRLRSIQVRRGTLVALLVVLVGSGGLGCPVIPLQVGRVDAVFHYRQTYALDNLARLDPRGQQLGPRLLTAVLGQYNYCAIESVNREHYLSSLFANDWHVRGSATAIISPSPWSTDGIIFEAQGRNVIGGDNRRALATSDYYVTRQSIDDVKELLGDRRKQADSDRDLRWVDLLLRQVVVREVEIGEADQRFVDESELVIRLYIVPLDAEGVFAIAPVQHELGIMSAREPGNVYSVGCVSFDEPMDGRKIFDVRKRDSMFRVKDYPELLRRAGLQPQTSLFRPRWHGQSCAANEKQPQYRRSAQRSAHEWGDDRNGEVFRQLFPEPSCSSRGGEAFGP
jgi:hypothetical protein